MNVTKYREVQQLEALPGASPAPGEDELKSDCP